MVLSTPPPHQDLLEFTLSGLWGFFRGNIEVDFIVWLLKANLYTHSILYKKNLWGSNKNGWFSFHQYIVIIYAYLLIEKHTASPIPCFFNHDNKQIKKLMTFYSVIRRVMMKKPLVRNWWYAPMQHWYYIFASQSTELVTALMLSAISHSANT